MPADAAPLLPPNASQLERVLEQVMAGALSIDAPIDTLIDPQTISAEALPFLGWGLSVDRWNPDWTLQQKRDAVASAIALQRVKGTPASVKAVLATYDPLIEYLEWWEKTPRGDPFTFEVSIPMDGAGGTNSTAAFAEAVIADIVKVKRGTAHFALIQSIKAVGQVGVIGAARVLASARIDGVGQPDTSQPWDSFLQTEDGEPLQFENAAFQEQE
ncbi:phage tail protein I [Sphingomonas oryzagri]